MEGGSFLSVGGVQACGKIVHKIHEGVAAPTCFPSLHFLTISLVGVLQVFEYASKPVSRARWMDAPADQPELLQTGVEVIGTIEAHVSATEQ